MNVNETRIWYREERERKRGSENNNKTLNSVLFVRMKVNALYSFDYMAILKQLPGIYDFQLTIKSFLSLFSMLSPH